MANDEEKELLDRLNNQEVVDPTIRQLLVARYSILHLYSDLNIENMLPTIEQIRAANSNPALLEAVEQKFLIFINFLRGKAEKLSNIEEQKELLFPAEDVLAWLIKKAGGQPIFYEVPEDKE